MLGKITRYAQGIWGLKNDDIILASFPRSGNTWVRFFLCHLISLSELNGKVIDFKTLDAIMPELGINNLTKPWIYKTIPRFVKTHKNCWPFFWSKKSVLIVRDPRDVMVSFYHHHIAKVKPIFSGDFPAFIRHKRLGLPAWFKHYLSWKTQCTTIVTYENLQENDVREFSRLLIGVNIHLASVLIEEAAKRTKFEKIKEIEKQGGLARPERFKKNYQGTRQGKIGTWKDYFSNDDIAYYRSLCDKFAVDLKPYGYF